MATTSKDKQDYPENGLETQLARLSQEIDRINERNIRVETQKAWETSRTRLVSITAVTYVTMILVFSMLGSVHPFANALIPTTGFFLSTLSLPFIRKVWEKNVHK